VFSVTRGRSQSLTDSIVRFVQSPHCDFRPMFLGLFSNSVVSFSSNLVLSGRLFSINVVRKSGCFWARRFMFSVRYT
jgi:hypothetical protein